MTYRFMLTAWALLAAWPSFARAAPDTVAEPTWEKISSTFDQYFSKLATHHPLALITREDVEPLWKALASTGWRLAETERLALAKRLPSDREFFVRQLHTSSGRRFMQTVAVKFPDIYDRLDLLAQTNGGGKPAVRGLIAAPDAEKTVRYMFSKGGRKSWASLLPERQDFNKPTGRIYTAEALKRALQVRYEATK